MEIICRLYALSEDQIEHFRSIITINSILVNIRNRIINNSNCRINKLNALKIANLVSVSWEKEDGL
jgi:hypothetical protein